MATIAIKSPAEVKWTRIIVSFPSVEVAQELASILLESGAELKYQEGVSNSAASEKARKRTAAFAAAFRDAAINGGSPLDYLPANFEQEIGWGKLGKPAAAK